MGENVNTLFENVNNSSPDIQLKYSRQNIQLRRAEVLRLQAMGESESSIAKMLGVSQAIISLDVQFLRSQARDKIAEHLDHLGYEFEKILSGLDILIKTAYGYLLSTTTTNTTHNQFTKEKIIILETLTNLYNLKWQLLTDKDPYAISHVTDYVNKAKKELEEKIEWAQINWEEEEEEEEENNNV
jgi:hypothetical protein